MTFLYSEAGGNIVGAKDIATLQTGLKNKGVDIYSEKLVKSTVPTQSRIYNLARGTATRLPFLTDTGKARAAAGLTMATAYLRAGANEGAAATLAADIASSKALVDPTGTAVDVAKGAVAGAGSASLFGMWLQRSPTKGELQASKVKGSGKQIPVAPKYRMFKEGTGYGADFPELPGDIQTGAWFGNGARVVTLSPVGSTQMGTTPSITASYNMQPDLSMSNLPLMSQQETPAIEKTKQKEQQKQEQEQQQQQKTRVFTRNTEMATQNTGINIPLDSTMSQPFSPFAQLGTLSQQDQLQQQEQQQQEQVKQEVFVTDKLKGGIWGLNPEANVPSNIAKLNAGKKKTGYTPSFSALIFGVYSEKTPDQLLYSGDAFRPIFSETKKSSRGFAILENSPNKPNANAISW
jgi:hypothetical protein